MCFSFQLWFQLAFLLNQFFIHVVFIQSFSSLLMNSIVLHELLVRSIHTVGLPIHLLVDIRVASTVLAVMDKDAMNILG